jgi:hypothetical protein
MKRFALGAALVIAGLVAAVGIGLLANTISGDSVGLSAQPLSAGDTLAPPASERRREAREERADQRREARRRAARRARRERERAAATPPATPPATTDGDLGTSGPIIESDDDSSGQGRAGGDDFDDNSGSDSSGSSGSGSSGSSGSDDSGGGDSSGHGSGDFDDD